MTTNTKKKAKKKRSKKIAVDRQHLVNALTKNPDLSFTDYEKEYPKKKIGKSKFYVVRKEILKGSQSISAATPKTKKTKKKKYNKPGPKLGSKRKKKKKSKGNKSEPKPSTTLQSAVGFVLVEAKKLDCEPQKYVETVERAVASGFFQKA